MASRLKTLDSATGVGLGTALAVYMIYRANLPSGTDVRAAAPNNVDVDKSRRMAAIQSGALISLVFLITRDINAYIISGGALVGIDYLYKHQNAIHPATQKFDAGPETASPTLATAYPIPDYTSDDMDAAGY